MKKKKERRKKITLAVILVLIVVIAVSVSSSQKKSNAILRANLLATEWNFEGESTDSYSAYLSMLKAEDKIKCADVSDIVVEAADYIKAEPAECFDKTTNGVVTYAGGTITYEINVPVSGTYYIEVGYLPTDDGNLAILRNLLINDETPFLGANGLTFDRMWVDETKDFLMKTDKNQGFPTQIQAPEYTSTKLESSDRTVSGPFMFYFAKGNNTISFEAVQSTLELAYVKLVPTEGVVSYEEYLSKHSDAKVIDAATVGNKGLITVQAEDTLYKSSATLLPQNDRTSPKTVPYHYSNIVLNSIGGSTWNQAGNNITWQVDVPESGLYKIATRFMQAENRDFYSAREIKINGELPFEEASAIPFYYKSKFQVGYLGNEDGAYLFYFEKGKNTITMTVTLGELSYAVEQTSISVKNFNNLYRELTAIMSSTPDTYRDYDITSSVPSMLDVMSKEYVRLTRVMESLGDTIDNNSKTTEISRLLILLEQLIDTPNDIAKEFKTFSDDITAVAQWMLELDEQPLQLDYLMLCADGATLPKAEGNFFENFGHKFMAFVGSFTNDYRIETETNENADKNIVVWIATSTRDQYDIVQRLINNAFKDKEYTVELKMVGAGTVMPATLTGNGPDVAIQLDYSMPTNFAFRNAGYDLTNFADYEEVASRFAPGALEYFEYNGGIYALPDEMSFPVMFYRTDIFEELGLKVPNTWTEVIEILPYLQSENMSMYFSYGTSLLGGTSSTSSKPLSLFFASRLYQNGIELYRDGGDEVNLDILDAGLTFKEWTEYYTKQSFALSISEITRFRRGEVPLFIDDYTIINSIEAAAPEIEGAWAIAPIPGTVKEDGSIDRSTACMVGSCMILKTSVEKNDTLDEAWEFLKWWTSADVQVEYAEQQKSLLGDAADFPLANLEAIRARAKEKGTYDTIDEILGWVRGVPQVPGGYITGREVENAFLETVNSMLDPVDTLYSKLRNINNELTSKREEFGLE